MMNGSIKVNKHVVLFSLCEKCPNTKFFLVRIFPHSDWIRRDTTSQKMKFSIKDFFSKCDQICRKLYFFVQYTPYHSIFNLNEEKYEPEKTPYLDIFHAVFTPRHNKRLMSGDSTFLCSDRSVWMCWSRKDLLKHFVSHSCFVLKLLLLPPHPPYWNTRQDLSCWL